MDSTRNGEQGIEIYFSPVRTRGNFVLSKKFHIRLMMTKSPLSLNWQFFGAFALLINRSIVPLNAVNYRRGITGKS